jgi:hypothetical protein
MKIRHASYEDAILGDRYKMTSKAVVEKTSALVREKGISIVSDATPLNGEWTYALFHKGQTE